MATLRLGRKSLVILGVVIITIIWLVTMTDSSSAAEVVVFKSATCGCCEGWSSSARGNGYDVDIKVADMPSIKMKYGIPTSMESCHTAIVGDYFVEGHIPTEVIDKLLEEQPDIDGIALPNMPSGSPGMPGMKRGTWTIYAIKDGEISTYMEI